MYILLVQFSFCHPKKYTINCKKFCLKQINILFLREQKVKPVIGHLCKKYSIWFSNPEESLFYIIANNLNGFQSVDSLANTLNKRCMALQNQLSFEEVFPENNALFHNSWTKLYNKKKETENDNWTGSCNLNLEDEKESENTQKSLEFRNNFQMCFPFVVLRQTRRRVKFCKRWIYIVV